MSREAAPPDESAGVSPRPHGAPRAGGGERTPGCNTADRARSPCRREPGARTSRRRAVSRSRGRSAREPTASRFLDTRPEIGDTTRGASLGTRSPRGLGGPNPRAFDLLSAAIGYARGASQANYAARVPGEGSWGSAAVFTAPTRFRVIGDSRRSSPRSGTTCWLSRTPGCPSTRPTRRQCGPGAQSTSRTTSTRFLRA